MTKKNAFAEALLRTDLDETLATIMTAVGIQTGDVAGQCFNDNDRKTYTTLKGSAERAEFIATCPEAFGISRRR